MHIGMQASCLHRTRAAWLGATQQNTIDIIISDAVYTGCSAAQQIPISKLLTRSIHVVLKQSSNYLQCFVTSSVDAM